MDSTTAAANVHYNYPQLFDIDDQDLFQGLNLTEATTTTTTTTTNFKQEDNNNNNIYTNSYLDYLQSNNNNNLIQQQQNDYFYDMMMIPPPPPTSNNTMDLIDYDYFTTNNNNNTHNTHNNLLDQQKQQYNWLYDPIDTFLSPQQPMFTNDNGLNIDSIMSEGLEENITVEGGMSRGFVSLSDVNSFVAEADSMKHSNSTFCLNNNFSSSESTLNDESEEEDEYSDSETEFRWPMLNTSYSTPTSNMSTNKQKLMIKIKKPSSSILSSALPSPYGEQNWNDFISPKSSKSSSTAYRTPSRKSMSNIFNMSRKKSQNKLFDNTKRRGSAPHRLTLNHNHSSSSLGSLNSSSSLTSLSNNLTRSMRVSDPNFLSEDEEDLVDEEEDDEDDEYQIRNTHNHTSNTPPHQLPTKKGRNVDKACNHCKRSHLRCDDMRPCRRCVATGKTGCKDVQHKPRGRPKLHKK